MHQYLNALRLATTVPKFSQEVDKYEGLNCSVERVGLCAAGCRVVLMTLMRC